METDTTKSVQKKIETDIYTCRDPKGKKRSDNWKQLYEIFDSHGPW